MVLPLMLVLAATPQSAITLGIGTQKVISLQGMDRIGIQDESVLDARFVSKNQLLLIGKSKGASRVIVFQADGKRSTYDVTVRLGFDCYISELRRLVGPNSNITSAMTGDKMYITGEARTLDDVDAIEKLATLYPSIPRFITLSPKLVDEQVRAVNDDFEKHGWKVHVVVAAGVLMVDGAVEDRAEALKVDAILAPLRMLLASSTARPADLN